MDTCTEARQIGLLIGLSGTGRSGDSNKAIDLSGIHKPTSSRVSPFEKNSSFKGILQSVRDSQHLLTSV